MYFLNFVQFVIVAKCQKAGFELGQTLVHGRTSNHELPFGDKVFLSWNIGDYHFQAWFTNRQNAFNSVLDPKLCTIYTVCMYNCDVARAQQPEGSQHPMLPKDDQEGEARLLKGFAYGLA